MGIKFVSSIGGSWFSWFSLSGALEVHQRPPFCWADSVVQVMYYKEHCKFWLACHCLVLHEGRPICLVFLVHAWHKRHENIIGLVSGVSLRMRQIFFMCRCVSWKFLLGVSGVSAAKAGVGYACWGHCVFVCCWYAVLPIFRKFHFHKLFEILSIHDELAGGVENVDSLCQFIT